MVAEFYEKVGRVDELLGRGEVSAEEREELMFLLEDREVRIYFFENAHDPIWLTVLSRGNWLSEGLSAGEWPAYPYLREVAAEAPERVSSIAQRVSKTRSTGIRRKVLRLAAELPPSETWEVVARVTGWIEDDRDVQWLADPAMEYCRSLAESSRPSVALPILEGLLRLGVQEDEDTSFFTLPRPKLREWQYQETIQEAAWPLFRAVPRETWESLVVTVSEGLRTVLDASGEERASGWEPSYPRSAIEEHNQNSPPGALDHLIAAVRDMSEELLDGSTTTLSQVVSELESYRWSILDRVALHLVRRHAAPGGQMSREHIFDRSFFSSYRHHHEYYLLVREHYSELSSEDRERFLTWIDNEIDKEVLLEDIDSEKEDAEEEAQERIELRRLNRLSALTGSLPDEWERNYEQLVTRYGQPEHPEFLTYTTTDAWIEDSSDLDASWFAEATVDEIAELCFRATAEDDISPSVLGRHLSSAVAEAPDRFSPELAAFRELPPAIIRGLLRGFRDASSDGKEFSWRGLLELCRQVLTHDYHYAQQETGEVAEDWTEARKAVADLISTALKNDAGSPSVEHREQVWAIVQELVDDPDPPQTESWPSMEPATQALNTTRGQALHAVFRYCWWIKRESPDDGLHEEFTLDRVAEARDVLNEHVDPGDDRALAIRAVFGQWYPSVVTLDPTWSERHVEDVFPISDGLREQWQAAWRSYLVFWYPNGEVYPLIRGQYRIAVERLTGEVEDLSGGAPLRDPEVRLGEHLLALHSWGLLEEYNDREVLRQYMAAASLDARKNVIRTVGTQLLNSENGIEDDILEKLRWFWEERLRLAEQGEKHVREELGAFVVWFSADVFDMVWAAQQLSRSLKLVPQVPDHPVNALEVLARYTELDPLIRLECTGLLLGGQFSTTLVRTNTEEVRSIVEDALKSPSVKARERAKELIDDLGRQGAHELRDLLEEYS